MNYHRALRPGFFIPFGNLNGHSMIVRVGITGGIGSGKSTVAAIFETMGIPIYKADDAARRLMNDNAALKENIQQHFGTGAYKNGQLDRAYLATTVFNNQEKLGLLNSFVHPVTIQDGIDWMNRQTTSYAIKEAAIIFESGTQRDLDYIIGVSAPETLRIHRSMKRDHLTREDVKKRMDRQMDDAIKMKLCDTVINNDGQQALIPQVMNIHQILLARAAGNNTVLL